MSVTTISLPDEIMAHIRERKGQFVLSQWIAKSYREDFMLENEILKKRRQIEQLKKEVSEAEINLEVIKKQKEEEMKRPLTEEEAAFCLKYRKTVLGDPEFIEHQLRHFNNSLGRNLGLDEFRSLINKFKSTN